MCLLLHEGPHEGFACSSRSEAASLFLCPTVSCSQPKGGTIMSVDIKLYDLSLSSCASLVADLPLRHPGSLHLSNLSLQLPVCNNQLTFISCTHTMSSPQQHTMQSLYAAIGDCADGKLSEEDLAAKLEQAGKQLDDREQKVVESLLNSK